jgi:hypothetical protein
VAIVVAPKTLFFISIYTLWLGICIRGWWGSACLGTLLGVRATAAGFDSLTIRLILSGYFLGYIVGAYQCPRLIRRFRHIRVYAAMAAIGSISALVHGLIVTTYV